MTAILFLLLSATFNSPDDSKVLTIEVKNCTKMDKPNVAGMKIYLGSASNLESREFFGLTNSLGQKSKKLSASELELYRELADDEGKIQVSVAGMGLEMQNVQSIDLDEIGTKPIPICAHERVIVQATEFPIYSHHYPQIAPSQITYTSASYTNTIHPQIGRNCCCCFCCCCCRQVIPFHELTPYGW